MWRWLGLLQRERQPGRVRSSAWSRPLDGPRQSQPELSRGAALPTAALSSEVRQKMRRADERGAPMCAPASAGGVSAAFTPQARRSQTRRRGAPAAFPLPAGTQHVLPYFGPGVPPSRSLLSRGPRGARLARAGNRPAPSHPLPPGAPRPGAAGRPPPSRRLSRPQVRRDGPRERGRPGRGPGAAGAERGAAERRGGGGGAGRGAAAPRGEAGGREEESRANFVRRARSRPGLRVRVSAERSGPGRGLRGKG